MTKTPGNKIIDDGLRNIVLPWLKAGGDGDGKLFNMAHWLADYDKVKTEDGVKASDCGTVCCIGGALDVAGVLKDVPWEQPYNHHYADNLFYPNSVSPFYWPYITAGEAAQAVENFLADSESDPWGFLDPEEIKKRAYTNVAGKRSK